MRGFGALSLVLTSGPRRVAPRGRPLGAGSPPPASGWGVFFRFFLFCELKGNKWVLLEFELKGLRRGRNWLKVRSTDLKRPKLFGLVSVRQKNLHENP